MQCHAVVSSSIPALSLRVALSVCPTPPTPLVSLLHSSPPQFHPFLLSVLPHMCLLYTLSLPHTCFLLFPPFPLVTPFPSLPPSLQQSARTLASCALLSSTWIVTTTFQQQVGGALDAVETAGTPFTLASTRVPAIMAALCWQVRSGSHTSTHTHTDTYSVQHTWHITYSYRCYIAAHAEPCRQTLDEQKESVSLSSRALCPDQSHHRQVSHTTRSGSQLSPGEARPRRESSCSPHNVHCLQHFSSSVPLHKHQITTFFAAFRLHTQPAILMQHMHVPISQCLLSQPLNSCTPLTTRSARTHCTVPASRPLPTQALLPPPPQAVVACVSDSLHKTT